MNPRKSLANWQEVAQGFFCARFAFARRAGLRNDGNMLGKAAFESLAEQVCYPFPSTWPDPSRVRSFFVALIQGRLGRAIADAKNDCIFHFRSVKADVESSSIKTPERGLSKCRKNSSSWLFSRCRWLVASRRPRQPVAPVLARPPVPFLALSLKTTSRKPQLLAACWALLQPTKAIATDLTCAAADLRQTFYLQSHPSRVLGWLFSFQTASYVRARAT